MVSGQADYAYITELDYTGRISEKIIATFRSHDHVIIPQKHIRGAITY
jgi:hypothetical protein